MTEIDSLIDAWGEDTVRKAFWLQSRIKNEGLRGIHYMDTAETVMEHMKDPVVYENIRSQMKNEY